MAKKPIFKGLSQNFEKKISFLAVSPSILRIRQNKKKFGTVTCIISSIFGLVKFALGRTLFLTFYM